MRNLIGLLSLWGCLGSATLAQEQTSPPPWSDEQEVIYQLRELIRYEEEQERLHRESMQTLSLPVGVTPATDADVSAGEGKNQGE
ncbi:MAG: hypothetical protein P8166_17535 [Candidatus Thiodiazotropha sp.]|jgi:hypothetical protein